MTENKIKYDSYENSFYINDDEGISQIIAPELIIEIINDYEKEIVKLKQENKELKEVYDKLKHYHSNLYDELQEVELERNSLQADVESLEKENKELKLQLEAFKDKLCELGVSDVKLYGKRYYTGLEEWLE